MAEAETDWISLKTRLESVEIERQKVDVPVSPSFRTSLSAAGKPQLEVRLSVDLAGFQAKVPAILDHWSERKSRKCGLRWSFPDLAPVAVAAGRLSLEGSVRVQQYACAFGAKTRLWRETARFALALRPAAVDNRIRFIAELEDFDLGKSILADVGAAAEVEAAVQGALQSALAADDANLGFPEEVAALRPELTGVRLEGEGGRGVLVAEARADADAATLQVILKLLTGL